MKIVLTKRFNKEAKTLLKKYSSLAKEIVEFGKLLKDNPTQGTPIGRSCYKIRLAISSKGKGKSGGARVITFVQIIEDTVYLLSIYDKSEKESISETELNNLLKDI